MELIDFLRENFSYNPNTGVVIYKKHHHYNKIGTEAGHISGGYRYISYEGKVIGVSKLAWMITYGKAPLMFIDHINGNKLDNRIANLREANHQVNNSNRKIHRMGKKSGISKTGNSYIAQVYVLGSTKTIGSFPTQKEAVEARSAYIATLKDLAPTYEERRKERIKKMVKTRKDNMESKGRSQGVYFSKNLNKYGAYILSDRDPVSGCCTQTHLGLFMTEQEAIDFRTKVIANEIAIPEKKKLPKGITFTKNTGFYKVTDYSDYEKNPKGKYAGQSRTLEGAIEILIKLQKIGSPTLINDPARVRGVIFHKATGKWAVVRKVDGIRKHLGLFPTKHEAETYALSYDVQILHHPVT